MPKGFRNGQPTKSKGRNVLDTSTPDIFGDREATELAIDWGLVRPENVVTIISRVCHAGGYVSFSAPPGGEAIKFSLSIGGSAGNRWCHSGQELNGLLAKALDAIQEYERGLRDSTGVVGQPSEPAVKSSATQ